MSTVARSPGKPKAYPSKVGCTKTKVSDSYYPNDKDGGVHQTKNTATATEASAMKPSIKQYLLMLSLLCRSFHNFSLLRARNQYRAYL